MDRRDGAEWEILDRKGTRKGERASILPVSVEMRVFDRMMFQEWKIGGAKVRTVDLAFALCMLVLAFLARWKLMPVESADYYGFLKGWMEQIRENGGFRSLGMEISNYSSPYMYLMCLLSYLKGNDLYALKLVSVVFDYVAAGAVLMIVYRLTGSVRRSILGMSFLLFSPAVLLDSAYWAQCDMIYAAFLLIALYWFFRENSRRCLIFAGIAFAFKLQAVFLLPFFIIMWAKQRTVKLRHFLWIPAIYAVSIVPAWLMGRSLPDLLGIYFGQADYYPWGTLNYPNLYALLGEAMPDMRHAAEVSGAGLMMTIAVLGGLAYYLYTMKVRVTDRLAVSLALLTAGVIVYTLPHMHERYGILLDLLAVVWAMLDIRKLPVFFGFSLISVVSFMPYLIGEEVIPLRYTAAALLALLLYVGCDVYRQAGEAAPASSGGQDPTPEPPQVQPPFPADGIPGDDRVE